MIDVIGYICLEQTGILGVVQGAAAVDKAFGDVADLGDVEMFRDRLPSGPRGFKSG